MDFFVILHLDINFKFLKMKTRHSLVIVAALIIWVFTGCTGGSLKTSVDGSSSEKSSSLADGAAYSESAESTKSDEASLKSDVDKDLPEDGGQEPKTNSNGLLTAGEWNDLDNWAFWTDLMKSDEWKNMQTQWDFYTTEKISVIVKNPSGQVIEDAQIKLIASDGKELWSARTDVFGSAVLFPAAFAPNQYTNLKITVSDKNGKTQTYEKLSSDKINELTFNGISSEEPILDIMFVTDATGSMGDEITYLQAELSDIVTKINKQAPELSVRVGNLFYRDRGDEYVTRLFDFTTDMTKVQRDINAQEAGGGGDYEEAVEEALYDAVKKMSWSKNAKARIMFLILDAPPHQTPANVKKIQKAIEHAAEKGIKVIPISASGIEKNTEFLMRFFSITTNSTYTFLTDDSGIGNSHLKPTVGKYDVEYLNDLTIRLILKYTGHKAI